MIEIRLKPDRERPVLHGHPWIFSGAVEAWSGADKGPGPAEVYSHRGDWIARGLAHPRSTLAVRILTRSREEPIGEDLIADRLDRALDLRERLFGPVGLDGDTNAYRLIFSESDGLSGLIIDRYADTLAVQIGAAAWTPWLPFIREHLAARTGIRRFYASADPDAVDREGLDPRAIESAGLHAPAVARIRESGFEYDVDLVSGQKTGFYLDQRESRRRVAPFARDADVLSVYCYTGAFEIHAAAAGARSILGIDASRVAIDRAQAHHALNRLNVPASYREGDAPTLLRRLRDEARSFDLVILDPPRFVASERQIEKGLRAYKDINLLALKLLRPGGILATFSCSGWVKLDNLRLALAWAATDAGREVQILETLAQPPDHPALLSFPESIYLHGLIARAV